MRAAMLATSVIFIGGFLALTIYAAFDRGFTALSVISLLIVGMMATGIIGAIWQGFDEDD